MFTVESSAKSHPSRLVSYGEPDDDEKADSSLNNTGDLMDITNVGCQFLWHLMIIKQSLTAISFPQDNHVYDSSDEILLGSREYIPHCQS